MKPEAELKEGEPRLLAVDNEAYVPVNEVVKLQITAADVIHSFVIPAFGVRMDALSRMVKLAAATLAVVPAWAALALLHAETPHGPRWLLTALAIVWAADSGAYFAGSHWGQRKLSPRISPNKTVEGLLGGIVAGVVIGLVFALFAGAPPRVLPAVALAALLTVAAAVVGDLFESLLKRHAGAKDSGDLLPGHGGVLDRLASVLAALPVFVIAKLVFGF